MGLNVEGVIGNHDLGIIKLKDKVAKDAKDLNWAEWTCSQLKPRHFEYLNSLPTHRCIDIAGTSAKLIRAIKITAFDGYHYSDSARMDSVAYHIETGRLKMFFPGNVRTYDKSVLPKLPGLDYLFAHLWLGYETALDDEHDLLGPFCDFSACLNPATIMITHLYETARENHSYWNMAHAERAIGYLKKNYPEIKTRVSPLTEKVLL